MNLSVPPGYVELVNHRAVARTDVADAVRDVLARGPLYEWAAQHAGGRTLHGRIPAYAVLLGGVPVVVRRNHHGGLLAPLRSDLFFASRAPRELEVSLYLAEAGVPTPQIIAYAIYRAGPLMVRSDVVTRELPAGRDFGEITDAGSPTDAQVKAVNALLGKMSKAAAQHPDLNVKNIYVADGDPPTAYALDVDRVHFSREAAAAQANALRLGRSMRKRNRRRR